MLTDLHAGQPLLTAGVAPAQAAAGMVLVHGRGGDAPDMLNFAQDLGLRDIACVAPQAANNTWYPQRFIAPLALNEPWLTSALQAVERALATLQAGGLPRERLYLVGFSQGACLVLEYAARNAQRYAGVFGLSGGLIGPDTLARHDTGSLAGTPVFLGCNEEDPHIPKHRVEHAASTLTALGAVVETRFYPGYGHGVHPDEIARIRAYVGEA